jgi:hypothetical protein
VTITDLNKKGTGIFFAIGLDSPCREKPVGQINRPAERRRKACHHGHCLGTNLAGTSNVATVAARKIGMIRVRTCNSMPSEHEFNLTCCPEVFRTKGLRTNTPPTSRRHSETTKRQRQYLAAILSEKNVTLSIGMNAGRSSGLDYPDGVREAALAHKYKSETTAAYQRGQKLEKRRALIRDWAQFLAGSNVISFREVG